MSALPCYLMTEAERRETARRTWREDGQRRRARTSAAARQASLARTDATLATLDLTPEHRYWLDRFSLAEIVALGGGLLLFGVLSSTAPNATGRTPELRGQEVAA